MSRGLVLQIINVFAFSSPVLGASVCICFSLLDRQTRLGFMALDVCAMLAGRNNSLDALA